jgi:hypothetical protein
LDNDAARELAEDIDVLLLQTHEARFHSGECMLARLDQAKNGRAVARTTQELLQDAGNTAGAQVTPVLNVDMYDMLLVDEGARS